MDISVSPRLRSCRSLPEICCGDRAFRRSQATRSFSRGSASIFRRFGRLRDFPAPVLAWCARYARRPPCRAISRDTTDGFRPIVEAMSFCCIWAVRQREISSLSANVSISRRTLPPIRSRVRRSLSHHQDNPPHHAMKHVRRVCPLRPIATTDCDQAPLDGLAWQRFASLSSEAGRCLATDPATAATLLHEALDLWRGPVLSDLADGLPLLRGRIAAVDEARLTALEQRIQADLAVGHCLGLVAELGELVFEYPLREQFTGHQMVALYRCGRQAEALSAFRHARAQLARELGIDPSPDLRRLHDAILRHDPSLDVRSPARHTRSVAAS